MWWMPLSFMPVCRLLEGAGAVIARATISQNLAPNRPCVGGQGGGSSHRRQDGSGKTTAHPALGSSVGTGGGDGDRGGARNRGGRDGRAQRGPGSARAGPGQRPADGAPRAGRTGQRAGEEGRRARDAARASSPGAAG